MQKRDFAVFTIVRNEPFYLPIWCDYYARNFGEESLFILDNSTSDSSVRDAQARWPGINVGQVPSEEAMLYGWTTEVAKTFQRVCLEKFQVVIFADADEYLIPSARYANLREFCDVFLASPRPYVRAQGWAPIQQLDVEPPLERHGLLLEQRNSMWRTKRYDKTLISKVPLNWAKGIHTIYDDRGTKLIDDPVDVDLALVHTRDVDAGVFHRRCVDRSKMKSSKGLNFGSTDFETVKAYFQTLIPWWQTFEPSDPEYIGTAQPVPLHWKTLLRY